MTRAREKRHEENGQGVSWLGAMVDLLRGAGIGLIGALTVLAVAAGLVSLGMMSDARGDGAVVAACLLGGLLGGGFAVRRRKAAPLITGLGAGGMLFLLLLTAGVLLYDVLPTLRTGGVVAGACLCGGGLAGVLGGKPKKKRRK